MAYELMLSAKAEKDLAWHAKSGNKTSIKKIYILFEELVNHPYTGTGKPEPLRGDLAGYWSRRINKKDRIIYQINEDYISF